MDNDVSKIILSSKEKRLLKQFEKAPLKFGPEETLPDRYSVLLDKCLIENPKFVVVVYPSEHDKASDASTEYALSELGYEYLIYQKERFKDVRLPFLVSTALAVIAIIISVIALFVSATKQSKEPTPPQKEAQESIFQI